MAENGDGEEIAAPVDEADAYRFLKQVESHPDFLEIQQRLDRLAFDCKEDELMSWSKIKNVKDGRWTVGRRQLHRKIGMTILGKGESARRGNLPLGVILLGAPGSGKTTVGQQIASEFGVKFVTVNADDYKELLPEYRGWNAGALHEESAFLAEEFIYPRAVEARSHLLFDMTGTNGDKMEEYVEDLTGEGYNLHVVFVSLPPWKAIFRAWCRFQLKPLNRNPKLPYGRFVPPRYIFEDVGARPKQTYERLCVHAAVVSWQAWSTDVPIGSKPVMIDFGKR
ncbi:MAG: zeta toxin family protein [Tepidisphaeraceae bacterium]